MKLQERWYYKIKPVSAYLKFRLPYPVGFIPHNFEYLDGLIIKQPWAPYCSVETRIVPNGKSKIWNIKKYESQMFYYNTEIRNKKFYLNPLTLDNTYLDYPELLNDHDSIFEITILLNYYKKININKEPSKNDIINLSRLITKNLNLGNNTKYSFSLSELRKNPKLNKNR